MYDCYYYMKRLTKTTVDALICSSNYYCIYCLFERRFLGGMGKADGNKWLCGLETLTEVESRDF